MHFFHFFHFLLMFVKLVFLINFLGAFFNNFLRGLEISVKFAFVYTFFDFLAKQISIGHVTFYQTLKSKQKKAQKSKNVFSNCCSDFNFAPIKGSIYHFVQKKIKFVVSYSPFYFDSDLKQIKRNPIPKYSNRYTNALPDVNLAYCL